MIRPLRILAAAVCMIGGLAFSGPDATGQVSADQTSSDRLTAEMYLDFEDVRPFLLRGGMGPQVSPDGSQVLYQRKHIDKMSTLR